MLSQGLYNYTTAFGFDNEIMKAKTLLLSYDPIASAQGQSVDNYVKYANSGGNMVILNTEGSGDFAKMFFDTSNIQLNANYVIGPQQNITLPEGIKVENFEVVNSTDQILSNYVTNDGTSPFITEMALGKGKIFYVNVEPIVNYLSQVNTQKSEIYKIAGDLLNGIDLEKFSFKPLAPIDGYASGITMDGTLTVNATSLLFKSQNNNDTIKKIQITAANGVSYFSNVSSIQVNKAQLAIESTQLTIKDGQGFYSQLSFSNATKLGFASGAELIITSNGEQFDIPRISTVFLTLNNPLIIWARTPTVSAEKGIITQTYSILGIGDGNLTLTGGFSFNIEASDSYSLLSNFKVYGSYTPSQNYYDELKSLPLAFVIGSFLAIGSLLLFLPSFLKRRRNRSSKNLDSHGSTFT